MADSPLASRPAARSNDTFVRLVLIFLLYPPVVSFLFAVTGVPVPAYLVCTLLGVVIVLTTTPFSLRVYPTVNRRIMFAIALMMSIFISGLYTVSPQAWVEKLIFIAYTILVPVIALYAAFFFRRHSAATLPRLEKMLYRHAVWLLWLSTMCLLAFGKSDEGGRLTLPGLDNTIWVSRYFGVLALVIFCSRGRPGWRHLGVLAAMTVAVIDLLIIGSRAPLVAVMLVLLLRQYRQSGKTAAIGFLLGTGILLFLAYLAIGGYVFDTGFYSIYDRLEILSIFSEFSGFPVGGYGVGSFGIVTTGVDYLFYPHNLMAEVFFEQGYVGLFLLLGLIFVLMKDFQFDLRGFLLIYTLFNSMGSGDIPGNNMFFILVFLCALPMTPSRRHLSVTPAPAPRSVP